MLRSVYLGACIRYELLEGIELKGLVLCVFVKHFFVFGGEYLLFGGRSELVQIVKKKVFIQKRLEWNRK